eukprot:m.190639 g.190639  ORF g.190639 m.190639 type:complete len:1021 (+) comp15642_c0_seq4:577-3639(+)
MGCRPCFMVLLFLGVCFADDDCSLGSVEDDDSLCTITGDFELNSSNFEECERIEVVDGDVLIRGKIGNADCLATFQTITGSLIVEDTEGLEELIADSLFELGDALRIVNNADLMEVALPMLVRLHGLTIFESNPVLEEFNADALQNAQDIEISSCPNLASLFLDDIKNIDSMSCSGTALEFIRVPKLRNLESSLSIFDNTNLEEVDLSSLEDVADLHLYNLANLKSLYLSALGAVDNLIEVHSLGSLEILDIPSLSEVGGGIYVYDNSALTLVEMSSLDTVKGSAGLRMENNPKLEEIDLNAIKTVEGNVKISNNPNLENVYLREIESIGWSFKVYNNAKLQVVDIFNLRKIGVGLYLKGLKSLKQINSRRLEFTKEVRVVETGLTTLDLRNLQTINSHGLPGSILVSFSDTDNLSFCADNEASTPTYQLLSDETQAETLLGKEDEFDITYDSTSETWNFANIVYYSANRDLLLSSSDEYDEWLVHPSAQNAVKFTTLALFIESMNFTTCDSNGFSRESIVLDIASNPCLSHVCVSSAFESDLDYNDNANDFEVTTKPRLCTEVDLICDAFASESANVTQTSSSITTSMVRTATNTSSTFTVSVIATDTSDGSSGTSDRNSIAIIFGVVVGILLGLVGLLTVLMYKRRNTKQHATQAQPETVELKNMARDNTYKSNSARKDQQDYSRLNRPLEKVSQLPSDEKYNKLHLYAEAADVYVTTEQKPPKSEQKVYRPIVDYATGPLPMVPNSNQSQAPLHLSESSLPRPHEEEDYLQYNGSSSPQKIEHPERGNNKNGDNFIDKEYDRMENKDDSRPIEITLTSSYDQMKSPYDQMKGNPRSSEPYDKMAPDHSSHVPERKGAQNSPYDQMKGASKSGVQKPYDSFGGQPPYDQMKGNTNSDPYDQMKNEHKSPYEQRKGAQSSPYDQMMDTKSPKESRQYDQMKSPRKIIEIHDETNDDLERLGTYGVPVRAQNSSEEPVPREQSYGVPVLKYTHSTNNETSRSNSSSQSGHIRVIPPHSET